RGRFQPPEPGAQRAHSATRPEVYFLTPARLKNPALARRSQGFSLGCADPTEVRGVLLKLANRPGNLLHILFIAQQRRLRDPDGFEKCALGVGIGLLQERMLLPLAARRPAAADTRHSGINR